ncbi:bone morphogenetic protein 4 [Salminus brasiliensis]|uniref:bone morphogenetic protein 4 n=1 Tax=Salminus brasiliensis TaxID=930266 RepID=UPI003B8325CE
MQNSAAQYLVFFFWVIFFNSSVGEPRALLDFRGTDRTLQLEALKMAILEYLGMDRPPESREKIWYQDLFRLYHQYKVMQINTQPFQRDFSLIIFAAVQPLNSKQGQNGARGSEQVHWFRAVFQKDSRITKDLILEQARLQLQLQPLDDLFSHPLLNKKIMVKILKISNSDMVTIFDSKVFHEKGHSVTLDVTLAVGKWIMQLNTTLLIVDIGLFSRTPGRLEPTLQLYLELKTLSGKVRKARSNKENSFEGENHCSRKSLSVSFEEIGWSDWIVAPAGYTMFFCDGSCPHNYKPASMHAQVKSHLHRLTKGETPRPCCVPAAYEPMILMHYDSQGKLKLTPFNDLIVSKCYCA